jgi:hypothetical protein
MILAFFFLFGLLYCLASCAPLPSTTNGPIPTSEDKNGFNSSAVTGLIVAIIAAPAQK